VLHKFAWVGGWAGGLVCTILGGHTFVSEIGCECRLTQRGVKKVTVQQKTRSRTSSLDFEPEIDNLGLKTKSCMDRLRRAEGADSKRKYELERVEEVYGKYSREDTNFPRDKIR